jgi:multicomponent Na+:H+ antiporter subunit E
MSTVLFLVLAGVAWMGLRNDVGLASFATGVAIGWVVWKIERARAHRPFSLRRALKLLWLGMLLFFAFLWELLLANLQQLRIIFAPRISVQPRWIRFRTRLQTPAMRALFGVMISLTPGTVTAEDREDEDGGWIIGVHALDAADDDVVVARIRSHLEAPLERMESL